MPATIRIVVLDNRWLLLDNVRSGAAAGHRRAEEYIDYQHDEKQNAKSHRQPQQPQRMDAAVLVQRLNGYQTNVTLTTALRRHLSSSADTEIGFRVSKIEKEIAASARAG